MLTISHSIDIIHSFLLKTMFPLENHHGGLDAASYHFVHCLPLYLLDIKEADPWKPKKTKRKGHSDQVVQSSKVHCYNVFSVHYTQKYSDIIFYSVMTLKFIDT